MKALTLHQPWASLIALGVKTIETRGWSTKYRGPLAIHAGARKPDEHYQVGAWLPWTASDDMSFMTDESGVQTVLPRGAVVATCRLADVAPMAEEIPPQDEWRQPWSCLTLQPWPILNTWKGWGSADGRYMGDQLPYGDFAPGRFAWLLDTIEPLAEPVPAKGKQGLWEWTA